jgi:hypothetical protein
MGRNDGLESRAAQQDCPLLDRLDGSLTKRRFGLKRPSYVKREDG